MIRSLALSAAAALVAVTLAGAASAADEPPAPQAPPEAREAVEVKVVPPEKKICKSILRTNSRVDYIRVCLTKAEWDDVKQRHREGMDELIRMHDNPNPPGN